MKDMIAALQIFAKYQKETKWPTMCEHDVLMICDVGEHDLSDEDKRLVELYGFIWDTATACWVSFRYGSA